MSSIDSVIIPCDHVHVNTALESTLDLIRQFHIAAEYMLCVSPQRSSYWLWVSTCTYVCLAMPSLLLGYTSVSVCAGEWSWGIKPWLFAVKLWVVSEWGDAFLFDWAVWMGLFSRPPNCNPLFSPLSSPLLSAAPYSPRQSEREGERCLGGSEEWGLGSTRQDRMGTERGKNSLYTGFLTYLGFILHGW